MIEIVKPTHWLHYRLLWEITRLKPKSFTLGVKDRTYLQVILLAPVMATLPLVHFSKVKLKV